MDPLIARPPGPQGSPIESPSNRATTDFGPIPGAGPEGSRRSRIGISRFPWWSRRWLGLSLLGLIILPWLPISGLTDEARPGRRIRGLGEAPILAFTFAPDGATIATIQMDGRVALRDLAGGERPPSFLDDRGFALELAFAPDGRSLAVRGGADVFLHDIRTGGAARPLGMPIEYGKGLAFSPDGRLLAASNHLDREILLWDPVAGRERARLRGHGSPVMSLAFAPDGRSLASGSRGDGTIVLWDLATGRPLRRLGVQPASVTGLVYSPDGRWLAATGSRGGWGRLWDLEGRRGDRQLGGLSCARNPLAFSPDCRLLATAGEDGSVRLWDLATGAELRRVGGPADRLHRVAFSPDGLLLAASGDDTDIQLWDLGGVLGARPGRDR